MSRDPARGLAQFFGGRVCLDFANTIDWRLTTEPQELIPDYATFMRWCGMRGVLPVGAIDRLQARGARHLGEAAAVLQDMRDLRDDICRAAVALCQGETPNVVPFNRRLESLPSQPRLMSAETGYVHDLPGKSLAEPLWPILWSLTALLTSQDASRLGSCQAQGCGWFFVDESPNHSRLWCSSEVCGNRERARRAYAKRRVAP